MARYDYGLRGPRETMSPHFARRPRATYGGDFQPRFRRPPPPNRVTAPYNLDYLNAQGEPYPRNPNPFGGNWYGQLDDGSVYRQPYITRAGSRTNRGSPRPMRYEYRDYGPDYGGRYPDEL
jgi:hypothetical protein